MYLKTYKIKVNVKVPSRFTENFNLTGESLVTQSYVDLDGLVLKSNSDRYSEAFKAEGVAEKTSLTKEGFILGQKKGKVKEDLFLELYENPLFLDDPKKFLLRYQPLIMEVDETTEDIKWYKAKITDSRVYLSLEEEFQRIPETTPTITLALEYKPYYKPGSKEFRLPKDRLVSLKEGFYSVYPKTVPSTSDSVYSTYEVLIDSYEFTEIHSPTLLQIGSHISSKAYINPKRQKVISSTIACKTPLTEKGQLIPDKEYILYKAEAEEIKPYCLLSSRGDEPLDEVKNLMKSHPEVLRPYFFVPSEVSFEINSRQVGLKTKGFEETKNNLLEEGIPQFNFNF